VGPAFAVTIAHPPGLSGLTGRKSRLGTASLPVARPGPLEPDSGKRSPTCHRRIRSTADTGRSSRAARLALRPVGSQQAPAPIAPSTSRPTDPAAADPNQVARTNARDRASGRSARRTNRSECVILSTPQPGGCAPSRWRVYGRAGRCRPSGRQAGSGQRALDVRVAWGAGGKLEPPRPAAPFSRPRAGSPALQWVASSDTAKIGNPGVPPEFGPLRGRTVSSAPSPSATSSLRARPCWPPWPRPRRPSSGTSPRR
jgi:hypothetical protein